MFENGSEFVRFDCHLHTQKDKEFSYNGDQEWYISNYTEALKNAGIGVGVISNHNKFDFDEYKQIKKAARKKDIFILPGVELSVKEGAGAVHTLIVFNPDEWLTNGEDHISEAISALFLGIENPGNANTHCGKDLITCIRELNHLNRDYFIIFAHVEQQSGLWKECRGAIITTIAKLPEFRERVLAFQKVRTYETAKKVREWMQYDVASVEGSDPKSIESIGKGDKECYIKIGEMSYDAVKYALRDFANRIFSKKRSISHGYIKEVRFVGGKLDGQVFSPSAELNTLIGIRGSGKSSVLEVIRYGLDIEPAKPDYDYKRDLVKSVLSSGGQVEIDIVDRHNHNYTIKRILEERPTIIDETGKVLSIPVKTIINNPLYFGQKDLALTRHGYELELLNRIVGTGVQDASEDIGRIIKQLSLSIGKYQEIQDIPSRIADLSARNEELLHKLKIYKEKGVDEKLRKQTACNEDLVKVNATYNSAKMVFESIKESFSKESVEELSFNAYESEFNEDILAEVRAILAHFLGRINDISETLNALQQYLQQLSETKKKLEQRIDSLKDEFAQIKREINDDSIDIDSYISYQRQLAFNNEEMKRLTAMLKDKELLQSSIKSLLDKRNTALRKEFLAYKDCISSINKAQSELSISIDFKGNHDEFKSRLKGAFKGSGLGEVKYDQLVVEFQDFPAIIEDYYLEDGKRLKSICTGNSFVKIAERIEESYAEYLGISTPNAISIMYHGKDLSRHSLGQRASALILFILTQNDSDLIIIDQPEDDLDNQVIYKELVQTIKREKSKMQFVFATHNANIPVLGDAERVVKIEYDADKDRFQLFQGTIDTGDTHKSIVDIMEGGEEAFKRRNDIYTSWQL